MIGGRLRIADAADLPLLQHAQQLRLQRDGHRVHLIEKNRPHLRLLEEPALVLHRAGEGALLVAEELGFEQVLRQRGAIDRHEGLMLPVRIEVQRARDELLARAALALDQDGRVGIRDLRDEIVDLLHPLRGADDVLKAVLLLDDLAQVADLALVVLVIERALDGELQLVHLERLGDVVVGAHLHRLDADLELLVGGDHDHRRAGDDLLALAQHVQAADFVHAHVGDDELRRVSGEVLDGLCAGVEGERLVASLLADVGDDLHHRGIVIDDKNAGHN